MKAYECNLGIYTTSVFFLNHSKFHWASRPFSIYENLAWQ